MKKKENTPQFEKYVMWADDKKKSGITGVKKVKEG